MPLHIWENHAENQAFYSFGIGGTVTILGYVYVETDHVLLQRLMTQTRFGKIVLQVLWRMEYALSTRRCYQPPFSVDCSWN